MSRVKWLDMGFGLVTGFIEQLQIVTTSNYSALTYLHTLQITVTAAHKRVLSIH
jgi:hypothetical protein